MIHMAADFPDLFLPICTRDVELLFSNVFGTHRRESCRSMGQPPEVVEQCMEDNVGLWTTRSESCCLPILGNFGTELQMAC